MRSAATTLTTLPSAAPSCSCRFFHASAATSAEEADYFHYDVALPDLDSERLMSDLAPLLNVTYLGNAAVPAEHSQRWPLHGVAISATMRRFVLCAPVQLRAKCVNVIFLMDTGAPATYLSTEALHALGLRDVLPPELRVRINGVQHYVKPVPDNSHFKGVSLLGADFLEDIDWRLVNHRPSRTFKLFPGDHSVDTNLQ